MVGFFPLVPLAAKAGTVALAKMGTAGTVAKLGASGAAALGGGKATLLKAAALAGGAAYGAKKLKGKLKGVTKKFTNFAKKRFGGGQGPLKRNFYPVGEVKTNRVYTGANRIDRLAKVNHIKKVAKRVSKISGTQR